MLLVVRTCCEDARMPTEPAADGGAGCVSSYERGWDLLCAGGSDAGGARASVQAGCL